MSKEGLESYQGGCLCGAVKYEITEMEPRIGHCHCSMCRKFHGAAFATLASVRSENFHWVQGEEKLKTFTAENETGRRFCPECGSSMVFVDVDDDGEWVEIAIGTLDSDIKERPTAHIFVEHGANWYDVTDHLPQYKDGSNSELISQGQL